MPYRGYGSGGVGTGENFQYLLGTMQGIQNLAGTFGTIRERGQKSLLDAAKREADAAKLAADAESWTTPSYGMVQRPPNKMWEAGGGRTVEEWDLGGGPTERAPFAVQSAETPAERYGLLRAPGGKWQQEIGAKLLADPTGVDYGRRMGWLPRDFRHTPATMDQSGASVFNQQGGNASALELVNQIKDRPFARNEQAFGAEIARIAQTPEWSRASSAEKIEAAGVLAGRFGVPANMMNEVIAPFVQGSTAGLGSGNLAVNQGNLAVNQGRLAVEREKLAREPEVKTAIDTTINTLLKPIYMRPSGDIFGSMVLPPENQAPMQNAAALARSYVDAGMSPTEAVRQAVRQAQPQTAGAGSAGAQASPSFWDRLTGGLGRSAGTPDGVPQGARLLPGVQTRDGRPVYQLSDGRKWAP